MSFGCSEEFYRYLRGSKNLSLVTVKGMVSRIPAPLTNLDNPSDLYDYYFSVLDGPTSSAHKRQIYYTLKYYCEFRGWPFQYKPPKNHLKRRGHAPIEDIWKMLDVIEEKRDKAMILVHLYTGLRPSEMLALKIKDVDMEQGLIKIRDTKTFEDRLVPAHRKAISSLKRYLESRGDECPYLFRTYRGEKKLSIERYRYLLNKYCRMAGIKRITPYMVRHSFATCYVENGGNIKALKEILGHRDIKTTEIYIHESEKIIKKDYDRSCPDF